MNVESIAVVLDYLPELFLLACVAVLCVVIRLNTLGFQHRR